MARQITHKERQCQAYVLDEGGKKVRDEKGKPKKQTVTVPEYVQTVR